MCGSNRANVLQYSVRLQGSAKVSDYMRRRLQIVLPYGAQAEFFRGFYVFKYIDVHRRCGHCWNARRTPHKKHAFFRVCVQIFSHEQHDMLVTTALIEHAHSFQCVLLQMLLPRAIEVESGLLQAVIVPLRSRFYHVLISPHPSVFIVASHRKRSSGPPSSFEIQNN